MTFDPRARAAQIAKEASDQISGEWPLLMNDLERIVESALIRFAREVLTQEPDGVMAREGDWKAWETLPFAQRGAHYAEMRAIYLAMAIHRAKSLEDGNDA